MIFRSVLVCRSSVRICSVSDTLHTPRVCTVQICPVQPCKTSRCAHCLVWPALVLVCPGFGTSCAFACRVQSFRVRWGLGLHRRGIWGEPGVGMVSPVSSEKNKKGLSLPIPTPPSQIRTHPIVQVSKFSEKYKKAPLGA